MNGSGLDIDLSGRVVLITGAGSGIGKTCAVEFASAGARLALVDRDEDALRAVADDLRAAGTAAAAWSADVTDADRIRTIVDEASAQLGIIDGLITSAGVHGTAPFLEIAADQWRTLMEVNFQGTVTAVQEVGRRLAESGTSGSMVLISSASGRAARPRNAHYAASKAAVLSLVKSAAAALAPLVRVNGVCPGPIQTPMLSRHAVTSSPTVTGGNLLQRSASPTAVSDAAAFLLSGRASFITGQALNVDGGDNFN